MSAHKKRKILEKVLIEDYGFDDDYFIAELNKPKQPSLSPCPTGYHVSQLEENSTPEPMYFEYLRVEPTKETRKDSLLMESNRSQDQLILHFPTITQQDTLRELYQLFLKPVAEVKDKHKHKNPFPHFSTADKPDGFYIFNNNETDFIKARKKLPSNTKSSIWEENRSYSNPLGALNTHFTHFLRDLEHERGVAFKLAKHEHKYAVGKSAKMCPHPKLTITNVRDLSTPLTAEDAQSIMNTYQLSKEMPYVVLNTSQFKVDDQFVRHVEHTIFPSLSRQLNIDATLESNTRLRLKNMEICGPGGCVPPSEGNFQKEDAYGGLSVIFAISCGNGRFTFTNNQVDHFINPTFYSNNYYAMAWDSASPYMMQPLSVGYLVSLTFDLISSDKPNIELSSRLIPGFENAHTNYIKDYFENNVSSSPLCYMLEHYYPPNQFKLNELRANDMFVSKAMIHAAHEAGYFVFISTINRKVTGGLDDHFLRIPEIRHHIKQKLEPRLMVEKGYPVNKHGIIQSAYLLDDQYTLSTLNDIYGNPMFDDINYATSHDRIIQGKSWYNQCVPDSQEHLGAIEDNHTIYNYSNTCLVFVAKKHVHSFLISAVSNHCGRLIDNAFTLMRSDSILKKDFLRLIVKEFYVQANTHISPEKECPDEQFHSTCSIACRYKNTQGVRSLKQYKPCFDKNRIFKCMCDISVQLNDITVAKNAMRMFLSASMSENMDQSLVNMINHFELSALGPTLKEACKLENFGLMLLHICYESQKLREVEMQELVTYIPLLAPSIHIKISHFNKPSPTKAMPYTNKYDYFQKIELGRKTIQGYPSQEALDRAVVVPSSVSLTTFIKLCEEYGYHAELEITMKRILVEIKRAKDTLVLYTPLAKAWMLYLRTMKLKTQFREPVLMLADKSIYRYLKYAVRKEPDNIKATLSMNADGVNENCCVLCNSLYHFLLANDEYEWSCAGTKEDRDHVRHIVKTRCNLIFQSRAKVLCVTKALEETLDFNNWKTVQDNAVKVLGHYKSIHEFLTNETNQLCSDTLEKYRDLPSLHCKPST